MTRLPILSKAIMEGMDVESVTSELQRASKSKRGGGTSSNLFSSGSSVTSSGEVTRETTLHDERSDMLSTAGTDASMLDVSSGLGDSILSLPSETSQAPSWADEFSSQMASSSGSDALAMPSSSHQHSESAHGSPRSNAGAYMSDSILSESAASTSASERAVRYPYNILVYTINMGFYRVNMNLQSSPRPKRNSGMRSKF